jgi:hypothetical protein
MLVKTGGGVPRSGQAAGIHWHMNIGFQMEYIPRDERRQEIPWVRVTDKTTGRVTVYQDKSNPLTEDEIKAAAPHTMDCMDCHNRPSHIYNSPDYAIDHAILIGKIDRSIPEIKKIAVEKMSAEYSTYDSAMSGIAGSMVDYYRLNYQDKYEEIRQPLERAILATQEAYSNNIFPTMKVRWSEYPNNIGHFDNPGCMRCHMGNHVNSDGVAVSHDCNSCHTILSQGAGAAAEVATTSLGLEFHHPEDIGEAWKESGCYECHTGVQP